MREEIPYTYKSISKIILTPFSNYNFLITNCKKIFSKEKYTAFLDIDLHLSVYSIYVITI
jgi:hypothetical protein